MRVFDIDVSVFVATRAVNERFGFCRATFAKARGVCAVVALRVMVLFDCVRFITLPPRTDADVVVARGIIVVVRAVLVRGCTVETRLCVFFSDLLREMAVPSRTAALAKPMQTSIFATKIRILFISDEIIANLRFLAQANNHKKADVNNIRYCRFFLLQRIKIWYNISDACGYGGIGRRASFRY